MPEKKYIVARNDFIVEQLLKKIYAGRLSDYDKVLLPSQRVAEKSIQKRPFGVQELYSIFRVNFDKSRIIRS